MNKMAMMIRLQLAGESLNNEGTIGNVIQPRQIEFSNGEVRQAISGEMFKHYHSRNVRLLAEDDELCNTCKIFSPMKNGKVKEVNSKLSPSGNKVKECIVDDIEGFMNAGKGANEKRTSCVKFSWAIATEENEYQTMLHTRVDATQDNNKKKENRETTEGEGNTNKDQNTQMLFHRPLRNNEYALTVQVDLDRIGFDDEKLIYVLDKDDIKARQKKCIKALLNMFVDIEGAMCSTRLPHIQNIEGIVVKKTDKNQVLSKYSALNDDYKEVNQNISDDSVVFNDIVEFSEVMKDLIK